MRLLFVAVISLAVAACASIGRPDGGPKDETPPVYVRSNPAPGTTNFKRNRIEVFFDENIKVEDAANKVVVSPAQQLMPQIIANGHRLTVTLRDSLIDDITYTIDMGDAIRDLNEGNILDGFVIDFSTGDHIDTLRISGMVFDASNLEPAQGIIVGAYRNLADSAVSTLKVERICKTNQLGQFTLRNLKDDNYRLFAINDVNRDYHWDRSEDIAFYNAPIRPRVEKIMLNDTLKASDGSDSIVEREGVQYFPNDILLTWFNENYSPQYLRDYSRSERNIIKLEFGAPSDTFPVMTIVNGENEGKVISDFARLEHSATRDTLQYWITDSSIIMQDSLLIETRYLKTDSTENLSWTTDTLRFFFRMSKAAERELEKLAKEKENNEKKRQEKIKKAIESGDSALLADTMPEPEPIDFLTIKAISATSQDYHRPVKITMSEPIRTLDSTAVKLEIQDDTIWTDITDFKLMPDTTGKILEYSITYPWQYSTKYKLTIDSAAVIGIYDHWNDAFKHEFTVKGAEDYSTIIFNIPNTPYAPEKPFDWAAFIEQNDTLTIIPDSVDTPIDSIKQISSIIDGDSLTKHIDSLIDSIKPLTTDSIEVEIPDEIGQIDLNETDTVEVQPSIMVELLSSQEAVVAKAKVENGKARFDFITPGTYYARAYIDFNSNGEWDTGNISEWRQAEDVFYYPKKITLKQNWDMEQTWDLFELPIELQKPNDIKKNKPKTKDGPIKNQDEDEEEEDDFGTNYFYPGNSYGNGSQYENARRRN